MPSDSQPRQLLIGLDAMEWRLVQRWTAEGKLPALKKLLESGVSGRLEGVGDSLPDTVWTTFCYGVNPGKLEKYFYVQYDPKTASLHYAADTSLQGEPFWEPLVRAGKRVGVVDVPHLPFRPIPNGFHLMNWGAHDNKGGAIADPPELLAEVQQHFGAHPVNDCERYNKSPESLEGLRQDILKGVKTHGELFRWLMREREWDFLFCCFAAAHCVGHHFWKFMDPAHPEHSDGDPRPLQNAVLEVYQALDREIGQMAEEAGPETRVLVVAPHGMGLLSHASWNLNQMLDLWGLGQVGRGPRRLSGKKGGAVNPWRILRMVLPSRLQYWIKDRLPRALQDELLFRWYAGGRTYRNRRAFSVPNNEVTGAIRLSVKGRDAGGIVEPGEEYRRLLDEICAALEELTDPATGRPVVRKITRLHEKFHGPFVDQLPDLAIHWEADFPWTAVESPRFGRLEIQPMDARSGSHTERSFLIATGPGLAAGGALPESFSILDIPASILETAGVERPEGLDGKPIPSAALAGT